MLNEVGRAGRSSRSKPTSPTPALTSDTTNDGRDARPPSFNRDATRAICVRGCVARQSTVCKIEQIVRRRRYIITDMDIGDKDLREIGPEAAELRLRVLRVHLMSIAETDRAYWSEKVHSREDASEYQKRQERLNEIRMEMMTLTPGSMQ
jgi:hypothetical protein